jgi:uncharacterized membrane protein
MFPSNSEFLQNSKQYLSKKYFIVFLSLLFALVLSGVLQDENVMNYFLKISPWLVVVQLLLSFFVSGSIMVGISSYTMSIAKGEGIHFKRLFGHFNSLKPFLAFLIYTSSVLVGLILLIVPGVILALLFSQVFFILANDSDIGVRDAFKKSKHMMSDRKMQFFLLQLRFFLYFLLGVFTLGIWWIWLLPKYYVAIALFFLELSKAE